MGFCFGFAAAQEVPAEAHAHDEDVEDQEEDLAGEGGQGFEEVVDEEQVGDVPEVRGDLDCEEG